MRCNSLRHGALRFVDKVTSHHGFGTFSTGLMLIAGASLSGCAGKEEAGSRPLFAVEAPLVGHLVQRIGGSGFVACDRPMDTLPLFTDVASQADSAFQLLGRGPLPVLLERRGNLPGPIRFAAPEGPNCAQLLPGGLILVRGTEPFWAIHGYADSATVVTPEDPGGKGYTQGRWAHPDSLTWVFTAVAPEAGDTLRFELTAVRCIEAMSGSWHPFEAEVSWGDRRLRGCAVEGVEAARGRP